MFYFITEFLPLRRFGSRCFSDYFECSTHRLRRHAVTRYRGSEVYGFPLKVWFSVVLKTKQW